MYTPDTYPDPPFPLQPYKLAPFTYTHTVTSSSSQSQSGEIKTETETETFYTCYTTTALPLSKRPLVILHGGPGSTHHYLLGLLPLHLYKNTSSSPNPTSRSLIFYDQLGNGGSTHLPSKPSSFWTPELFMDELYNLLSYLGVEEFDLLGHSWGGMLGSQIACMRLDESCQFLPSESESLIQTLKQKSPNGRASTPIMKHLIISNSPSSMPLWVRAANIQRSQLPISVQESLTKHEEAGTTDTEEYKEACMAFYKRHLLRLDVWPKEVEKTFEVESKDSTVYGTMNGPSEFTITGTLSSWSIIPHLPRLPKSLPVLLLNGKHDSADHAAMLPFFLGIQRCRWLTFENGSHMMMWEERERYLEVVEEFLECV